MYVQVPAKSTLTPAPVPPPVPSGARLGPETMAPAGRGGDHAGFDGQSETLATGPFGIPKGVPKYGEAGDANFALVATRPPGCPPLEAAELPPALLPLPASASKARTPKRTKLATTPLRAQRRRRRRLASLKSASISSHLLSRRSRNSSSVPVRHTSVNSANLSELSSKMVIVSSSNPNPQDYCN